MLAAIACGSVVLFALAARHGLDLTDEGFYLLNFRYWNATPLFTLFGAYFQVPYRLLGESLWAMRMLGAALLLLSGIACARELMRVQDVLAALPAPYPGAAAALAAGMTAFNYYGGFVVPYTPSYNALALICALAATALTLLTARALARGGAFPTWSALGLGLVVSVGCANKFSAGALVALIDAAIAALILWRATSWRRAGRAVALALLGFVLNLVVLAIVDPHILLRFRQGIAIQLALLPRDLAAEYLKFFSSELPYRLFEGSRMLMWPVVLALVAAGVGKALGNPRWSASVVVASFVGLAMYVGFVRHRGLRIEFISLVAALLWAYWAASRRASGKPGPGVRAHALAAAVATMPFAYSFGTNNFMLEHMAMAAVFPSLLIVSVLRSLRGERRIQEWAYLLSLSVVAAAPAEVFVRQWLDGGYTYRLGESLSRQTTRLPSNPAGVETLVGAPLADTAGEFLRITEGAGFRPGAAIFDFTGQSPGLVMLAGARPIGAAWIAGGGSFRGDDAATLAIAMLPATDLRRAWLLSSQDSFARIKGWRPIVEAKLGSFPYDEVGRMTLADPSSADKKPRITISVWRPRP